MHCGMGPTWLLKKTQKIDNLSKESAGIRWQGRSRHHEGLLPSSSSRLRQHQHVLHCSATAGSTVAPGAWLQDGRGPHSRLQATQPNRQTAAH